MCLFSWTFKINNASTETDLFFEIRENMYEKQKVKFYWIQYYSDYIKGRKNRTIVWWKKKNLEEKKVMATNWKGLTHGGSAALYIRCCKVRVLASPWRGHIATYYQEYCTRPLGSEQGKEHWHTAVVLDKPSPTSLTWCSTFQHCRMSKEWQPRIWGRPERLSCSLHQEDCSAFSFQGSKCLAPLCCILIN